MQKLASFVPAFALSLLALMSASANAAGPSATYFDSSGRDAGGSVS